ncbi:MAG: phosphate ABC transporter substrate-binding protein [Marinobacter sp.]|nr:phosphate ABC transporter substrate-binding protein [Marinobacter sp.]
MKKLISLFFASLLLAPLAMADVVVIGHPGGPDSISLNEVRDIYLNRSQQLPGGQRAAPYELPEGNATRQSFHQKVTGRNDAQLKAFWSQQVFTGRGQPPQELGADAAVRAAVASTPGGIGYISAGAVDDSVKVLLRP